MDFVRPLQRSPTSELILLTQRRVVTFRGLRKLSHRQMGGEGILNMLMKSCFSAKKFLRIEGDLKSNTEDINYGL